MMRVSRFVLLLLLLVGVLVVTGCAAPVPTSAPDSQKAVEEAVQATLTAVATNAAPVATDTPAPAAATTSEPSPQPATASTPVATAPAVSGSGEFVLPGTIPNFNPTDRPQASKGDAKAPVVMYQWSDYTCSHCKTFHDDEWPVIEEAYVKTGKLRLVYKEFPVVNGDLSVVASLAAQCAADQDKFWEMHDWLFANTTTWAGKDALAQVKKGARAAGADGDKFDKCFDAQTPIQRIVEDFREGQSYEIKGTPAFVINGHLIPGAMPIEQFKKLIDALITEAETGSLPAGVVTVTPSPTPDTNFDIAQRPVLGKADAPVTVVEFTDYQCPFCEQYFKQTYPQLLKDYVDTGKVKYIVKNFPLTQIHPNALPAAEAAECAGAQGKYWEMHDKLFGSQSEWSGQSNAMDTFKKYAADLSLDKDKFNTCLDTGQFQSEIDADQKEGIAAGVTGTPAFFINGVLLSGAQPIQAFKQAIDAQLAKAGAK